MPSKISPGQTKEARKAHMLVSRAVNRGDIVKPHVCELCGFVAEYHVLESWRCGRDLKVVDKIVAHHHRGYKGGDAMNVWFVCRLCNKLLGSTIGIGKDEARKLTNERRDQKRNIKLSVSLNIHEAVELEQLLNWQLNEVGNNDTPAVTTMSERTLKLLISAIDRAYKESI